MARAPSSEGKTRLAPHLSASQLASLRAALLADTLLVLEPLAGVTIFFTPDDAETEIAALARSSMRLVPQGDGDLGTRMLRALRFLRTVAVSDTVLEQPPGLPPEAALLVGSDIPLLGVEHLREAAETLEARGGIVLGPADDGGYYLIGMTEVRPGLFDEVAWGTDSVLTDTLRAAERVGVEARLIRSAYDIDTIDDLRRLARDLADAPATVCPGVRRWLSES
jgi:rSAM/selenodomain-associated transferase 1